MARVEIAQGQMNLVVGGSGFFGQRNKSQIVGSHVAHQVRCIFAPDRTGPFLAVLRCERYRLHRNYFLVLQ